MVLKRIVTLVAALLAVAGIVAVIIKGRGKGPGWFLSTPVMAYRVIRHFVLMQAALTRRRISQGRSGIHEVFWAQAQYYEDLLLLPLVWRPSGYCVEVGANDGVLCSNTYLYEKLGWTGLLIEPAPEVAEICRKNRPRFTTIQAAVVGPDGPDCVPFCVVPNGQFSHYQASPLHRKYVEDTWDTHEIHNVAVQAKTLDRILEDSAAPVPIDFVTIDVEGMEMDVLRGFSIDKWRPKVVILEASDQETDSPIIQYMRDNGYVYHRSTPGDTRIGNHWFVRGASRS